MSTGVSCNQSNCQVAKSGKCLEGFDPLEECPNLNQDQKTPQNNGGVAPTISPNLVALDSGEALTESLANRLTRQFESKVVLLAGATDSGKTTIITSLFEEFQNGSYSGYTFAGSDTLIGFERRCHDGREASGNPTPITKRTKIKDEVHFLHLRLAKKIGDSYHLRNLLLADISGEAFQAIQDSSDAVRRLSILKRIDFLTLVIDGSKIASKQLRHIAATDARQILRAILQEKIISNQCKICIVISKWDLIRGLDKDQELKTYFAKLRRELAEVVQSQNKLEILEIAARPSDSSTPFALGLPLLLRFWMGDKFDDEPGIGFLPDSTNQSREIIRFGSLLSSELALGKIHGNR